MGSHEPIPSHCEDCAAVPDLRCGACGALELASVACLGMMPLANALLDSPDDDCPRFPLHLAECNACEAVQLTRQVEPAVMFGAYPYYSSQAQTMVLSAGLLAERMTADLMLGARDLVVEIGSNDGYLLAHYLERGVRVLGVDPAEGPATVARERGVTTLTEFFGPDPAESMFDPHEVAVVHANNVMAHVPDPGAVLDGVRRILRPDGLLVIETPWLAALLRHGEWDTIYHEHRYYWSLSALARLLARHGLAVVRVEQLPIHGGSLRVFATHDRADIAPDLTLPVVLGESGISSALLRFDADITASKDELRAWWKGLESEGIVAGYGAAAKGVMLMNGLGVGPAFVCDTTPAKQDRYVPGLRCPILHPDALTERQPPNAVVLSWNWIKECRARMDEYVAAGGKVHTPMPIPQRVP